MLDSNRYNILGIFCRLALPYKIMPSEYISFLDIVETSPTVVLAEEISHAGTGILYPNLQDLKVKLHHWISGTF